MRRETETERYVRLAITGLIELIIIFYLAKHLYESYGLITLVGYLFLCTSKAVKILENPYRPIIWAVGFVIGATALNMIFENFLPIVKGGIMVSLISGAVILYVIAALYLKSRELKNG